MNWVLLTWCTTIGVCLVLAGIHIQSWLRVQRSGANGSFAAVCLCVAVVALLELAMMHATSTQAYLQLLRGFYVAVMVGFIALVYFVWSYLEAGRRWLGWLALAMRGGATVAGLSMPATLHFSSLSHMEAASFLGAPVMMPVGQPNPWMALAVLANLTLTAFLIDATCSVWRQRGRGRAFALAFALLFFAGFGFVMAALVGFRLAKIPLNVTLSYLPIILIMGARLSQDLVSRARHSGELAEAESRLLTSRHRLSLAAGAAKVGFWTLDPASMRFQGAAWGMRLFERHDDHAMSFDELLQAMHPADRDSVRSALASALAADGLIQVEYRMLTSDGSLRWFQSAGGGRYAESGDAMLLMGVTFDVTDRKLAEERRDEQREQAEHLARIVTVNGLSSVLADELRQPLTQLRDATTTALRLLDETHPEVPGAAARHVPPYTPALPAESLSRLKEHVAEIIAMNSRASQVPGKLRQLLRRNEPQREPVALHEVVCSVLDLLRPDLLRRGIRLSVQLDRATPPVLADSLRIEQMLINLIMHLRDAMADWPAAQQLLSIALRASPAMALLQVANGSAGIHMDTQADTGASPAGQWPPAQAGTALSICRLIVESHGGQIAAMENDNGGICWQVRLPFTDPEK